MPRTSNRVLLALALWLVPCVGLAWSQFEFQANPYFLIMRDFKAGAPQVGAPLPDVKLVDDHGAPVSTSQLRGNYTVLVFGCLT